MGEGVIQNKQNGAFSATELHLSNLPSGRPGSLGTPQTSSVRRASSSIVQDRTSTSDLQLSRHNSHNVAHEKMKFSMSASRISIMKEIMDTVPTGSYLRHSTRWSERRGSGGVISDICSADNDLMERCLSHDSSPLFFSSSSTNSLSGGDIIVKISNDGVNKERRVSVCSTGQRISITFTKPGCIIDVVETDISSIDSESSDVYHSVRSFRVEKKDQKPTREGLNDLNDDTILNMIPIVSTESYLSVEMISSFETERGRIFE